MRPYYETLTSVSDIQRKMIRKFSSGLFPLIKQSCFRRFKKFQCIRKDELEKKDRIYHKLSEFESGNCVIEVE